MAKAGIVLLKGFENMQSVVRRNLVANDYLIIWIILLKEHGQMAQQLFALVMAWNQNADAGKQRW